MARPSPVLLLLAALGAPALAQEPAPVYQQPKTQRFQFKVDALARQEWTDDIAFTEDSRRLLRLRPRVEAALGGGIALGLGGDFTYGSDDNLEPPEGAATLPVLRDNYVSRDSRLDLAYLRLELGDALVVQGGRFAMPIPFTEMVWDRDLRPQGAAATVSFANVGGIRKLTLTALGSRGSHVLPRDDVFRFEDRDTFWMGSATAAFGMGRESTFEATAAFARFTDLAFVDPRLRRQNTRVAGALVNEYDVVDLVARLRREGKVHAQLVVDYCWNTRVDADNRGIWVAAVAGSTRSARGALEYVYAKVDKDATSAAYGADDFLWVTGWEGHRLDLGVRAGDRSAFHVVGQTQRFKDSPRVDERDIWFKRLRLEMRVSY